MKIEKMASGMEYASIGLSCLGTVVAIATQQLAYVSAPLALSASLSLLNRQRELSKANQQITSLEQLIASDSRLTIDRINIIQQSLVTVSSTPTAADNQQIADICNRIGDLDYSIEDLKDRNFTLTSRLEDYQQYTLLVLKLIGTHEKYLVCDRSFAMLGSHNFLTSGVGEEREIGMKTTDLKLIEKLIERYEQAPDRTSNSSCKDDNRDLFPVLRSRKRTPQGWSN